MSEKKDIPVIILAGGFGTRLRSIDATRPKPMIPVLEKPFLYWQVKHLVSQGFSDFIFSTGYMAEQIEMYPWDANFPGIRFRFSRETEPLGTGGASVDIIKKFPEIDIAWIINGDTVLSSDLPDGSFKSDEDMVYTILDEPVPTDAVLNLVIDGDRIKCEDVSASGKKFLDLGSVLIKRKALEKYQGKIPCSFNFMAKDVMNSNRAGFRILSGTCYDIGTPERLKRFEEYLNDKKA